MHNTQRKKNRNTRSFSRNRIRGNEEVMRVGADAMIEDSPPKQEKKTMEPVEDNIEARIAGDGRNMMPGGVDLAAAVAPEDVPAPAPSAAPAENAGLAAPADGKSELETLREERDSYLDLARRERADFDNYRKRMQREMAEMKRASLGAFLKEFFGPLDDMDRVLHESEKSHNVESLIQGVRIMEENFWRALAKAGVKRIDANGKPFDPNLHEAMAAMPSADVPPNTVIEVYENGYKLDDFILRPARVIVSRAPDE